MMRRAGFDGEVLALLAATLLGISYLVANHYSPWTSFHAEFVAATALVVGLLACSMQSNRSPSIPIPRIALVLMAVASVPIFQRLTGLLFFSGDAFIASAYVLAFAACVWIGHALSGRHYARSLGLGLAAAILFAGALSVAIQLMQWLRVPPFGPWIADLPLDGRPYANLAQPNQLATLQVLSILAAVGLYEAKRLGQWTLCLLMALLLFGVAMTSSRAAILELGVLAGLYAFAKWRSRTTALRLDVWIVVGGALLLVVYVLAWPSLNELALLSGDRPADNVIQSKNWRMLHWKTLAYALTQRPLTGYGWNQVAVAHSTYVGRYGYDGETIEFSHNVLLDLLIWNGVPIGALLIGTMVWWMVSRGRRATGAPTLLAWCAIAVVLVHSLVEFPFAYLYFLAPLGLAVGLVEREAHGTVLAINVRAMWVATAFAALIVAAVYADYRIVEEDYRALRFKLASIGGAPTSPEEASVRFLDQLEAEIAVIRTDVGTTLTDEELSRVRKVAYRFPTSASITRLVAELARRGERAAAEAELDRIGNTFGESAERRVVARLKGLAAEGQPELATLRQVAQGIDVR